MPKRCVSSIPAASKPPSSAMLRTWLWGPLSPLGLGIAALTVLADQANKAWMLYVYDIGAKGTVALTSFFDLVLVWNQGISYGLLPQESALGRLGLILFAFAASLALGRFGSRASSRGSLPPRSGSSSAAPSATPSTASPMGRSPISSRCTPSAGNGTCSMSPIRPLLPVWWDFCMTPYSGVTKRSETLLRCKKARSLGRSRGNLGAQ